MDIDDLIKRIDAEHPVEDLALAKLRVMAISSIPVIDKAFTDIKEENKRLKQALEEIKSYCIQDAGDELPPGPPLATWVHDTAVEALKEE